MSQQRAIVIGSGFGGAVAACRLAQAGFQVTVLERGRRFDGGGARDGRPAATANTFPRGPVTDFLFHTARGPYDVRPFVGVQIVQGAGYGGGSLVYANVHMRPPPEVFEHGWPPGYTRAALDPYYDLVAWMLDLEPITRAPRPLAPKTLQMNAAAAALGREAQLFYPHLAVRVSDEETQHPNKFGVTQGGCVQCGECVIGCNHRAKNTLDFNYLAVAEKAGALMKTECEVHRIEPHIGAGVPGYRVRYRDLGDGSEQVLDGEHVFVCAGAINSTELLLRCREAGALPELSRQLGLGYSGNGDLIAFGFETREAFQPDQGPTITTTLLYDDRSARDRQWFLVQEGGFPQALWPLVWLAEAGAGLVTNRGVSAPSRHSIAEAFRRNAADALPVVAAEDVAMAAAGGSLDGARAAVAAVAPLATGAMAHTAVLLALGRDLASGRIELRAGHLHVTSDVTANLPLYETERRLSTDLARALGGRFAANPFWRFAHLPISVHNLGGCRMGESDAGGVTDGHGEVFHYPNLFVLDGAILPAATGANPSHTIAAVAERNIEAFIRRATGDVTWRPPERPVPAIEEPLDGAHVPSEGTPPPRTTSVGLHFDERMTGRWTGKGGLAGAVVQSLTVTVADVARFVTDEAHAGILTGHLDVAGLTRGRAEVSHGTWNLFVAGDGEGTRAMRYALPFTAGDGRAHLLSGTKVIRPHPGLSLWHELTRMDFHIIEGDDPRGQVVGRGALTIGPLGVASLLASMRVDGEAAWLERARAVGEFVGFYLGTVAGVSYPSLARRDSGLP